MKFTIVVNLIIAKYNINNRLLILIIDNANNNNILYIDLITYFLIIEFNNIVNIKKNEKISFLHYFLYLIYII